MQSTICRWEQVNIFTALFCSYKSKQHVDKIERYLLESCKLLFSRVILIK